MLCDRCYATGQIDDEICDYCEGTGGTICLRCWRDNDNETSELYCVSCEKDVLETQKFDMSRDK